jgi:hypothetical protein
MIKSIALFIVFYTTAFCLAFLFYSHYESAASCALGGVIMLVNLLGLTFLWYLVFSKKSIALAVFVIIFKYLILGFILWKLADVSWMKPVGLVIGLSTLVLAILSATMMKSFVKTNKTL